MPTNIPRGSTDTGISTTELDTGVGAGVQLGFVISIHIIKAEWRDNKSYQKLTQPCVSNASCPLTVDAERHIRNDENTPFLEHHNLLCTNSESMQSLQTSTPCE